MDPNFKRLIEMIAEGAPIKTKDRGKVNLYLSSSIWQECKDRFPGDASALVEKALARAILEDEMRSGSKGPKKRL
jgi:hypothetical protein